jgi:hypothetical protein
MSERSKYNKYGTAPKNLTEAQFQQAYDVFKEKVKDVLPLSQIDSNVLSDEDSLIKFLIARQYNVEKAEAMLRYSIQWRTEFECEKLFSEKFDKSLPERWPSAFYGKDMEGHPVYIEQPDGGQIRTLIQELGVDAIFRWHIYTVERQRQIMKHWNSDRVSIILDAKGITMGIATNTTALSFLKNMSTHGQAVYPEGLRYMFIVNAPFAVTVAFKVISPLLDPVVREKIHIWGHNFLPEITKFIAPEDIPKQLGGSGGDWYQFPADPSEFKVPDPTAGVSPTKTPSPGLDSAASGAVLEPPFPSM